MFGLGDKVLVFTPILQRWIPAVIVGGSGDDRGLFSVSVLGQTIAGIPAARIRLDVR